MAMDDKQKTNLAEFIERIGSYRARHTELITVLVSKGYDINFITRQLEGEKSTAANIKGTSTRKNVQDALDSLIRICKNMKQTPKNGVALFAGNVSQVEGQDNFITEVFEPPEELNVRLYRCDQTFVVEPLEEMLEVKELYGLMTIERQEATIAMLVGKKIKILQKFDSMVPGKTNKGGQCLSPDTIVETKKEIKKLLEIQINDEIKALDLNSKKIVFTKCLNKWKRKKSENREIFIQDGKSIICSLEHTFFKEEDNEIKEVEAKNLSLGNSLLTYHNNKLSVNEDIKKILEINKNLELIDIETEIGNFFANGILVHNSAARYGRIRDNLARDFYRKVAEAMKDHFFNMTNLKGIIIGGPGPTKEDFLKEGELVTSLKNKVLGVKDIGYSDEHGIDLLVEASGDILAEQEITKERKLLERFFNMLGKDKDKTAYGEEEVEKALSYGAVDVLYLSKKLSKKEISHFEKKAIETGVKIEMISVETEEGVQFYNLSGIGAILRFKIV